jgi:hypothetical protein
MDVDKRKDVDQLPNALYPGVSMKTDGSGFYYNSNEEKPEHVSSIMRSVPTRRRI